MEGHADWDTNHDHHGDQLLFASNFTKQDKDTYMYVCSVYSLWSQVTSQWTLVQCDCSFNMNPLKWRMWPKAQKNNGTSPFTILVKYSLSIVLL